jgi:hypothetical protein
MMAITCFSLKFDRELDASQYLDLLGYDIKSDPELKSVDKNTRDFIHRDLICPSCGIKGVMLVSGAQSKLGNKKIRQPHFRFYSNGEADVHDKFCDLREENPFNDISCEKIDFSRSKSLATKLISEYVSKAIANGFIKKLDIAKFRIWHLDIKRNNVVELSLDSEKTFHYLVIQFRRNKNIERFHPKLGEIESLNWNIYALDRIAIKDKSLFEEISKHDDYNFKEKDVASFVERNNLVFDVRILSHEYKCMLQLREFIHRNVKGVFKTKYDISFLDAFVGVLLYVNNWDYQKAIFMFIDIVNSKSCDDYILGNIIALDPFKDYQKISFILNMNDVSDRLLKKDDLDIEVKKEIYFLRCEYKVWKDAQLDNGDLFI